MKWTQSTFGTPVTRKRTYRILMHRLKRRCKIAANSKQMLDNCMQPPLSNAPFLDLLNDTNPLLGTGQVSIIILSVKTVILPPRLRIKKTYPEVVSRSMPRTLKDFCQRACSQTNPQGHLRKTIWTAQVCGLRTVRIFFAQFYGFRAVRKIRYRPGSAVSVPSAFFVF